MANATQDLHQFRVPPPHSRPQPITTTAIKTEPYSNNDFNSNEEDIENTYTPESPDLSGRTPLDTDLVHPQHQSYRASSISLNSPYTPIDSSNNPLKSPFGSIGGGPRRRSSYFGQAIAEQRAALLDAVVKSAAEVEFKPVFAYPVAGQLQPSEELALGSDEMAVDDEPYVPEGGGGRQARMGLRAKRAASGAGDVGNGSAAAASAEPVEVRTKFPVARIKRIMQADEDVGKVAQVTPTAVSKALELFMISLVTKVAAEARQKGSKRVLPTHLKQVVLQNDQFDFLNDIVGKIADAPPAGAQSAAAKHEDSGDEMQGASKKKKPAARKKRKGSEDL